MSQAKETTMAKKNTVKNNGKKNGKQMTAEQIKAREEAKAKKREEARLVLENGDLFIVSKKKNKDGKSVECYDRLTGRYEDNAIVINTDKYNHTIVTENADGTCWVDCVTATKETSNAYGRNNKYASLIRSQSKQNTIQALRGMTFVEALRVVSSSKRFSYGVTKVSRPSVEKSLCASAQRAIADKSKAVA